MTTIQPLEEQNLPVDCYVFKHSTQCPISAAAAEVVRGAELEMPLYWINVIEQRPLSNWVAEEYDTVHASPQLLKIKAGKVDKAWTHHKIVPEVFGE